MTAEPGLNFEVALKQLEAIVGDLERGAPELSATLAKYEQGVRLLARCHHLLDEAEQNVALLTGVDDAGRPITAPLDAAPIARDDGAPF
jgi:exodeoxyribonuclease VII small subunit